MKLRIKGDSLRLRLTRTEVARMAAGGSVEEQTGFGGGSELRYRLSQSDTVDSPHATFDDGCVEVCLPRQTVTHWAGSDEEVGIRAEQSVDEDRQVLILVEKDFACLTEREDEDESDMFAHPQAGPLKC